MAYEFLTKLFGTPKEGEQPRAMTAAELVAAIEADKNLSIVNLKDGGYVSADKYSAKETELKGVQAQLTAANETIKGFEGQDVEGIKKKVTDWETKYNTDTQQLKDQLAAQARSHAEEMFMSGYQFTSKAARNGVLAELRAKGLKVEDGNIIGGKEFMQSLMDNEDYKGAFVAQNGSGDGKGGADNKGGDGGNNGGTGGQQGYQSTTGNIYTGQNKPKFSAGTNGGVASGGDKPKFNFGFTHIREPEK